MSAPRPPRKAVLLAAGLGTRMRPLSYDLPKPMMPLHGVPLVDRAIDMLRRWGVRDLLVNLHHHPQDLFLHLRDRALAEGVRIHFSYEPDILDTAGALRRAAWFVEDGPFWLLNTDVAVDLDPGPMLSAFRSRRPLASVWLTDRSGPRTVEMVDGRIRTFRSRSPGGEGTFTFCGLHLLSPRILEWIPVEEIPYSIITAYTRALAAGEDVAGVVVEPSVWSDLGSPTAYLRAHVSEAGRGGPLYVSPSARVSPRAVLDGCVAWDGARIGPRARLRDVIVGRDVAINGPASSGSIVRASCVPGRPALDRALAALCWRRDAVALHCLAGRGSDRSFTRVVHGNDSVLLIEYGNTRPENEAYGMHARFLRRQGVQVPRVLHEDMSLRMLLLEDVGDTSLEDAVVSRSPRSIEANYQSVLDVVLRLHGITPSAARRLTLQPPFTAKLYRWEHDLLAEHFLCGRVGLSASATARVLDELASVSRRLLRAPRVLLHRDLQSSNILLHKGSWVFIDFQGMRWGPAAYDLASLLCDPYVTLPLRVQHRLLGYYLERCENAEAVRRTFWPAAVQRLSQALGAFGRLASQPETTRFEQRIGPGVAMLRQAAEQCGGLPHLLAALDR
jgi:NDP-sugar pyrophosphorylase family protein/aminoglycoside/choline kinase family phosphotransferase